MARTWPAFVTKDLGDSEADSVEMERRWSVYRDEMTALIAAGGVHRDADGWWVDDATGELIGPDPELERPLTQAELASAIPLDAAFPALADTLRRSRGKQKAPTKISTTIRLSPDVLDHFRATGQGWQGRIDDALRDWVATHG
jgi:uncharacterized protein (DUF4415 family)